MERYDVLDVMGRRLRETGLYTVDGTTLVDAELQAYAAGFQPVMEAYEELERELSIRTATDYGLTLREALVGQWAPHLSVAERRRMLLARLSIGSNDHTVPALERALDSVGIIAQIKENPAEDSITVVVTDVSRLQNPTAEMIQSLAGQFLPAHLLIEYDLSKVKLS